MELALALSTLQSPRAEDVLEECSCRLVLIRTPFTLVSGDGSCKHDVLYTQLTLLREVLSENIMTIFEPVCDAQVYFPVSYYVYM